MEAKKETKWYGWIAAIGTFIVVFCNLGAANTLGVFLTSISEYTGYSLATVSYIGTVNTVGNILLSMVAVKLVDKISARWTILISILCVSLHMWLYTLCSPGHGLIWLYLAGLGCSGAIAFGTHAVAQCVVGSWFIEKRESVCGIIFSAVGLGAAAWIFAAGQLFKYFDFKDAYRILSIPSLVLGLIAVFFMIKDPVKLGQKPLGWEKAEQIAKENRAAQELPGVPAKGILKRPIFWLLGIAIIICVNSNSEILCYLPSYWQMNGMNATQASNWYSIYFILAAASAWLGGKVTQKLGAKAFVIYAHIACCAAGILLVVWGKTLASSILILSVVAGALCYPLQTNIPANVTQAVFGPKDFAKISGMFMVFVYIGQFLTAPIMTVFLNGTGKMDGCWKLISITSIIGMILVLIVIRKSPMRQLQKEGVKGHAE